MVSQSKRDTLYYLNQGNAIAAGLNEELDRSEKVVCLEYDFANDGGAVGDITLKRADGTTYATEEDCIVTKVLAHEVTALTSGGSATVTLEAGSTGLTGALAFDSGFTGLDNLTLAGSADAIAVDANQTLQIAVGTAALTAGKVRFYIYMVPQRTN